MTYRTFDGTSQVESVTLGRYSSSKSGVSDGSTTQGAVYFSDDVDTGFYSPADNKIALITGGTERLHIDDAGKVGLGAAPGTQFEVNGANPYVTLKNTAAEDTDHGREAKLIFEGIQSGGEESTLGEIVVSHYGSADDTKGEIFFNVNDGSSAATVLKLNHNGHVGIGEYNPGSLLHVKASDTGIAPHASSQICLEREGTNYLQFLTAENGTSGLLFGDGSDVDVAKVAYDHNTTSMTLVTETATAVTIDGSQKVTMAGEAVITGNLTAINGYLEYKYFDFGAIAASSNETVTLAAPRSNKQLFVEITTVGHENTNNGTFVMRSQGVCNWAGTSKQRVGHGDTNYDESLGEGDYRSFGGGSHALDFDGNNLRLTVANSGGDTMAEVITLVKYIWSD